MGAFFLKFLFGPLHIIYENNFPFVTLLNCKNDVVYGEKKYDPPPGLYHEQNRFTKK
jgi:hypothetical protein